MYMLVDFPKHYMELNDIIVQFVVVVFSAIKHVPLVDIIGKNTWPQIPQ